MFRIEDDKYINWGNKARIPIQRGTLTSLDMKAICFLLASVGVPFADRGIFHYNNCALYEHLYVDIARLHAFQALTSAVHRQMAKNLQARLDAGNGRPKDFELKLGAFKEEIEPQVWNALKVMNKKGYETTSSGFAGEYGEHRLLSSSEQMLGNI